MLFPLINHEIHNSKYLTLVFLGYILFTIILLIKLGVRRLFKPLPSAKNELDLIRFGLWAGCMGLVFYYYFLSFLTSSINQYFAKDPVYTMNAQVTDKEAHQGSGRAYLSVEFKISVENDACSLGSPYCSFTFDTEQNLFYQVKRGTLLRFEIQKGLLYGYFIRNIKILG